MEAAIATIRVGTTEGVAGNCLNGGYTPTWTLNNPSRPVHVDCLPAVELGDATPRGALGVPELGAASPAPTAQLAARVDVIFYDDGSFGRAVGVQTWSNQ